MKIFLMNYGDLIKSAGNKRAGQVLTDLSKIANVPGEEISLPDGLIFKVHSYYGEWCRVLYQVKEGLKRGMKGIPENRNGYSQRMSQNRLLILLVVSRGERKKGERDY